MLLLCDLKLGRILKDDLDEYDDTYSTGFKYTGSHSILIIHDNKTVHVSLNQIVHRAIY